MKNKYLLLLLLFLFPSNHMQGSSSDVTILPVETLTDKIRGGLLGQILGNLNILPYEMKFYETPGNIENYTPSLPNGAVTDDDTDFEWVYIYQMQNRRSLLLSYEEIMNYWKTNINRGVWCSNQYARLLMDLDIIPPYTGSALLNPWANFNVSGQFLCESFGLIAPAMPKTAARIGTYYTRVAIDNEPAQVTQLLTTLISNAFIEHDINRLLESSMLAINRKSIIYDIITDVCQWYKENPDNWRKTRELFHQKYQKKDFPVRNKNGIELNIAAIISSLLYGKGNFTETIRYATNMGYDADCNAAIVGTIVGVMTGYKRMMQNGWNIIDRYKNTTREDMPTDETIITFSDRLIEVFEMVNQQNGGKKTIKDNKMVYLIHKEAPQNIYPLLPIEKQKKQLIAQFQDDIINWLLHGNKKDKARAAYIAICLDLNDKLNTSYHNEWTEACYELSGYWKIISAIFHNETFNDMINLRNKFNSAGFKKLANPPRPYSTDYYVPTIWKDPIELYK